MSGCSLRALLPLSSSSRKLSKLRLHLILLYLNPFRGFPLPKGKGPSLEGWLRQFFLSAGLLYPWPLVAVTLSFVLNKQLYLLVHTAGSLDLFKLVVSAAEMFFLIIPDCCWSVSSLELMSLEVFFSKKMLIPSVNMYDYLLFSSKP